MLAISDFRINLARSNDYLRCAILVHALALIVLIKSSWPIGLKIPVFFVLLLILICIIFNRIPLIYRHDLFYQAGYWYLQKEGKEAIQFQKVSIHFEGGLFVVLSLSGLSKTRQLIVFKDQMNSEKYRILKIYERKDPRSRKKNNPL